LGKHKEHLSAEQIKLRIMAYLVRIGASSQAAGANSYTIQHKANIPSQEFSRFRGFLDELCKLGCVRETSVDTSTNTKRSIYFIEQKGAQIVQQYRQAISVQTLFGSIEDIFDQSVGS
jgi:hypothetical protein